MTRSHRNRSWRAMWTPEKLSRTAVHKSGVIARVQPLEGSDSTDTIVLENTEKIDQQRWNLERLTEQAIKLWTEGLF